MGILSDFIKPRKPKTTEELEKEAAECERRANAIVRIENAKKKERDAKLVNASKRRIF